jgi:endonuclease YncB( thermonuclease family)
MPMTFRATANPPRGFRAYLIDVHDGDTLSVMVDGGFGLRAEPDLRLLDVSAPEVRPMQLGAAEMIQAMKTWLVDKALAAPRARRWPLWVEVSQSTAFEPDLRQTFTRYLAGVWSFDDSVAVAGGGRVANPAESLNRHLADLMARHPEWPTGS